MCVKKNFFLSLDGDASYKTMLSTKTKIEMAKTIGGFSFHCSILIFYKANRLT